MIRWPAIMLFVAMAGRAILFVQEPSVRAAFHAALCLPSVVIVWAMTKPRDKKE